ncbi:hypothetical protein K1T71_010064 [Dendrolimus kikuchii]|uniref:Uncharacterized protein n=1 Tax=Dendrolimus kikuchii TaxID=765133 RepID=A0ACC1CQM5_9NEOP|nr:hypothetical protein K1T71_010064 [Dendrolimus kikuchii]
MFGDAITWKNVQIAVGPNTPDSPYSSESQVVNQDDIEKIYKGAQNAMKHATPEEKLKFHEAFETANNQDHEDAHLNATQLLQKYNYPVEEHVIRTPDGYNLTLIRIPQQTHTRDVQKRPVAFLMHDLLGSADDWLLMGPGKSLAYLLSDAGYDVWLGNARGNHYSRHHVSKHPALKEFWQFSNDEIALHDLPAMIDHALETTHQEKLHYVGHGQGVTVLLALAATEPEYNEKIATLHALAPMAYMSNVRSPLLKISAPTSHLHEQFRHHFGHGKFDPTPETMDTVGGSLCENQIGCKNVCSNLNFVMAGMNIDGPQPENLPVIMAHLPAGTSTRTIKHFGQAVASHEFRKYDYGYENNKKVYGTPEPPKYEMNKVQMPTYVYHSEEDWLAHPKDVKRLVSELPNMKKTYQVPEEHFSHMDFQFSKKAPEVVYKQLIDNMLESTE